MSINTRTHSISDIGARWLAGNLAAMAITGTVICQHVRPPQLSGAGLALANLSSADLRNVNLEAAVLRDCNFGSANLAGANLRGANLTRANLSGSRLRGADLREADLRGANLEHADLQGADLGSALYDDHTAWTEGIDPQALGAMFHARTSTTRAPGSAATNRSSRR